MDVLENIKINQSNLTLQSQKIPQSQPRRKESLYNPKKSLNPSRAEKKDWFDTWAEKMGLLAEDGLERANLFFAWVERTVPKDWKDAMNDASSGGSKKKKKKNKKKDKTYSWEWMEDL
jgi:hypothetical protein